MLGAKYNGLRDVTLGEFEKPALKPNSVIIKNLRAGICGTDITGYTVDGPAVGIHPANQFGHEMVGVVDEIGEGALASLQFLGVKNIIVADAIPLRLEAVEKMGAIPCDVTKHQ